ncbi:SRPBCC domain-containing protein [Nocardia sp. NPDC051750]|uniref:SRPBCC domain-containing protein n=1 Tax=Nocardia sp. NPDC051750 TaxID=3364325 RepID=UPI00379F65DE
MWRALTESEHLRHWLPADIVGERCAGAEIQLPFWPESVDRAGAELEQAGVDLDDPVLTGRILTWDPPRLFEFLWEDEHLRFDLEPDRAGTRLVCAVRLGAPGPRGHTGTASGSTSVSTACANSWRRARSRTRAQNGSPNSKTLCGIRFGQARGGLKTPQPGTAR